MTHKAGNTEVLQGAGQNYSLQEMGAQGVNLQSLKYV